MFRISSEIPTERFTDSLSLYSSPYLLKKGLCSTLYNTFIGICMLAITHELLFLRNLERIKRSLFSITALWTSRLFSARRSGLILLLMVQKRRGYFLLPDLLTRKSSTFPYLFISSTGSCVSCVPTFALINVFLRLFLTTIKLPLPPPPSLLMGDLLEVALGGRLWRWD